MAFDILQKYETIQGSSSVDPNGASGSMDSAIQQAVNHRRLNSRQIQLFAVAGAIGK